MGHRRRNGQRELHGLLVRDTGGFRIREQLELGRAGHKEPQREPQRRLFQC